MKNLLFLMIFLPFIFSCGKNENRKNTEVKKKNAKAEYIVRKEDSFLFPIEKPEPFIRDLYPWEEGVLENIQKITKEFFRCKGSSLNGAIIDNSDSSKQIVIEDCKGGFSHSLPLINGKEAVYPVLLDILNYIQLKTKKKVIITCGHRCPLHNTYSDSSSKNRTSKHMIGAEVDFYVQGLEDHPMTVIDLIFSFYKENKKYYKNQEFESFKRYEKEDTGVSIAPWFNKEIFVKLYLETEGRDFDNRHPYPYISIQVRYDRDTKSSVVYSWERATSGYLRW